MKNIINWFEIPVSNFLRAKKFYESILNVKLQEMDMGGDKMGFFPSDDMNVSGAIVLGPNSVPSENGTLVYLNGGFDLNEVLNRVEPAGGKILLAKTQITPEIGYMAYFFDTEGNRIALHSRN